jgi:hypothetical protein
MLRVRIQTRDLNAVGGQANCPPETAQAFDPIAAYHERANIFQPVDMTMFVRRCVFGVVYSVSCIDKVKSHQCLADGGKAPTRVSTIQAHQPSGQLHVHCRPPTLELVDA